VPFALRFLFATNPAAMGEALRIVYRAISGFMVRKAGLTRSEAQCGSVTLIQRFGSALNLNVHFHIKGLPVRQVDSSHLTLEPGDTEDALSDLQGHSITYRIALGPHKGRKAFMLQTVPAASAAPSGERLAQASGFSLHAGVAARAPQRDTLERLCRYIARPAVAIERLSLSAQGQIRYALKTPYRDGSQSGRDRIGLRRAFRGAPTFNPGNRAF
jgi:hypothetical protein